MLQLVTPNGELNTCEIIFVRCLNWRQWKIDSNSFISVLSKKWIKNVYPQAQILPSSYEIKFEAFGKTEFDVIHVVPINEDFAQFNTIQDSRN